MTEADERPPLRPTEPAIGTPLGRYLLCYRVAAGGMATVYLAKAEGPGGFDKLVALKAIHPHLALEREFVDMFLDEARIAARISHPNVCSVFDFGLAGGCYYLAMDFLAGETVSRLSRRLSKLPREARPEQFPFLAARIAADACEGLHAAHELTNDEGEPLGLVHRDITPQNLFVTYDGSVKVVDFGVASAAGRIHHTTTSSLKGKYAYMSPEQVHRLPLDRRSDVWALGVCLWEMLTFRRLFRREGEVEMLTAVLEEPILPPSSVNDQVPPALDEVVLRALARDRQARYPSARDLARDLNELARQGGAPGMAELAALMSSSFAVEKARTTELMRFARKLQPGPLPAAPAITFETEPVSVSGRSMPSRTAIAAAAAGLPRPGRRLLWLVVALSTLLAAGTAAAVVLWLDRGGSAPSAAQAGASLAPALAPEGQDEGAPEPPPDLTLPREPEPADAGAPGSSAGPEAATGLAGRAKAQGGATGGGPKKGRSAEPAGGEAAAPSGEHGTVAVVTPPGWAEIYLGGRRVGRSPAEIRLPAGRHVLRLLPYGEEPAVTAAVEVPAGGMTRAVVRLDR